MSVNIVILLNFRNKFCYLFQSGLSFSSSQDESDEVQSMERRPGRGIPIRRRRGGRTGSWGSVQVRRGQVERTKHRKLKLPLIMES